MKKYKCEECNSKSTVCFYLIDNDTANTKFLCISCRKKLKNEGRKLKKFKRINDNRYEIEVNENE